MTSNMKAAKTTQKMKITPNNEDTAKNRDHLENKDCSLHVSRMFGQHLIVSHSVLFSLCDLGAIILLYQLSLLLPPLEINWHERAAFQRPSFGHSRSGGRLLAMT